jgi:tetratricopeptide (TPR) repeat protein
MDRDTLLKSLENLRMRRLSGAHPVKEAVVTAQQLDTWYGNDEVAVSAVADYHLRDRHDYRKAEEFYRRLCEMKPLSIEYRIGLSLAVEREGRREEARELTRRCELPEDVEPAEVEKLSRRLAELGECELALSHLTSFIERRGPTEDLLECEATLREEYLGDFGRAAGLFIELANASANPSREGDFLNSALIVVLASGDESGAMELAQRLYRNPALMRGPWRHAPLFNVGYALRGVAPHASGECLKACIEIMESELALDLMPRNRVKANQLQAMAFALQVLGRERDAATRLQEAIEIAESLEDEPRIFTFPQYRWLPRQEFLETARQQLEELKSQTKGDFD